VDALLSVTTVTGHPLNAIWLNSQLSRLKLVDRDGKLSPFFHFSYSKQKNVID